MSSEYYKNLPKKHMAAGALIFNDKGEVLIVKPSYKDHWSFVGGVVEAGESPRLACLREVKEEAGLILKEVKLLCIDYIPDKDGNGDSLQFIFDGGRLDRKDIESIKIDGKEITDYKFLTVEKACPLLNENSRLRLAACMKALKSGSAFYLEKGKQD